VCSLRPSTLPDVSDDIASDHDRERKIDLEKVGGNGVRVRRLPANGPNGDIALGEEDEYDEDETDP